MKLEKDKLDEEMEGVRDEIIGNLKYSDVNELWFISDFMFRKDMIGENNDKWRMKLDNLFNEYKKQMGN